MNEKKPNMLILSRKQGRTDVLQKGKKTGEN
jgi:hypothetical protein